MEESVWTKAFLLESKVADIISDQATHGCNFKSRQASWYVHNLNEKIINIDKELIPLLPRMLNVGTSYKKPFKLNGQFMKYPGIYCETQGLTRKEVGGPFTALYYTPFDPSKTAKVKEVMLQYGWRPEEWNIKRMPFQVFAYRRDLQRNTYARWITQQPVDVQTMMSDLTAAFIEKHFKNKSRGYMVAMLAELGFKKAIPPTFDEIKKKLALTQFWPTSPKITPDKDTWIDGTGAGINAKIGKMLALRMQYSHRRSLLQGLGRVTRPDGKIAGEANPCATPTARMKHKKIVNIPSGGALFGTECRGLFIGNYNQDINRKPKVFKAEIGEGMRVKPHTNMLQELNAKTNKWQDTGHKYRIYLPANQDVFVGGDGAGLTY